MKKLLHTIILSLLTSASIGQIYSGNIYLSSQEDVDNFTMMYPDVTYIAGTLEIISNPDSPDEILNLDGLSILTGADNVSIYSRFVNGWNPQSINNLTLQMISSDEGFESYLGFISFQEGFTSMQSLNISLDFTIAGIFTIDLFPNLLSLESLEVSGIGSFTFPSLMNCVDLYYYPRLDFELTLPVISNLNLLFIDAQNEIFLEGSIDPSIPNIEHINEIMFSSSAGSIYGFFNGITNLQSCGNFEFPGENAPGSVFPNLHTVEGNLFLGSDFDPIGLPSLESVGGEFTLAFVNLCPSSIEGLDNLESVGELTLEGFSCSNLESLASINHVIIQDFLSITGFPNLSFCSEPNICNFIQNHTPNDFVLEGNADGCNSGEQIIELCIENAVNVIGTVFVDTNCNGTLDGDENPYFSQLLQPMESAFTVYGNNDYSILTAPTNTIQLVPENLPTHFQMFADVILDPAALNNSVIIQNIALCAVQEVSDLSVSMVYYDAPRPGFDTDGAIIITNTGSVVSAVNASVEITTATAVANINAQNNGIVDENVISWADLEIPAGTSITLQFSVTINANTDLLGSPLSMIGSAFVNDALDIDPSNNTFEIAETIVGSYDPNDKTPNLEHINLEELPNGESINLTYRIRFQNTGTASAINVRITDLIEPDLNINTVQMLYATHDFTYSIQGDSITWYFNNIMLPDSTSDPVGSIGQLFFRIQSFGGHDESSQIENKASIYFDFNEPIITNTAITEFFTCPMLEIILQDSALFASEGYTDYFWYLDGQLIENFNANILENLTAGTYQVIAQSGFNCQDTTTFNFIPDLSIERVSEVLTIFPNPAADQLNIKLPSTSKNKMIRIIDGRGLVVKNSFTQSHLATIAIADLAAGIYTIIIEGYSAEKIIKE